MVVRDLPTKCGPYLVLSYGADHLVAATFVQRNWSAKKKDIKSPLVEMLLLPKGIIPLKDFSIGAKLKEFFLRDPRDLATCHI